MTETKSSLLHRALLFFSSEDKHLRCTHNTVDTLQTSKRSFFSVFFRCIDPSCHLELWKMHRVHIHLRIDYSCSRCSSTNPQLMTFYLFDMLYVCWWLLRLVGSGQLQLWGRPAIQGQCREKVPRHRVPPENKIPNPLSVCDNLSLSC